MKRLRLLFLVILFPCTIYSQTIQLSLPDETAEQGTLVRLDLTAADFTEIVSMQFSIHWNPAIIHYESFEVTDLPFIAVGDFNSNAGELRFSWFDVDGVGKTLDDGSSIMQLVFTAVGNIGDVSPVAISGDPLAIQIFKAGDTPGIFDPVTLDAIDGSVSIIQEGDIGFVINHPSCPTATDGEILLNVPQGANFTYHWTRADGFSSTEKDLTGVPAGVYQLEVKDENGAIIYSQIISLLDPVPITIGSIDFVETDCLGATGQATIHATGGVPPYYYNIWNQGNSEGVFVNLAAGDYALTITDANNCAIRDTFQMTSFNGPELDLGDDINLCTDTTITLDAGANVFVNWSTGETNSSIDIEASGLYSVTVTNDIGCTEVDSIYVDLMAIPKVVVENDALEICAGDTIQIQLSGADEYLWDASDYLSDFNIPDPLAFPDTSTVFVVLGTNECGADAAAVEVRIFETLADAGRDTCIITGTEVRLLASGGLEYFWEEAPYPVNVDDIPNPVIAPEDSTTYFVNILDANGCQIRDSVTVTVASDPLESVFVVNMITPNGDGLNDVLEFKGAKKFGQNSLTVYNRWGDKVYSKVNYQSDEERFDGTKNGKPLPAGNYYYVLSFQTGEIKQALTIVR